MSTLQYYKIICTLGGLTSTYYLLPYNPSSQNTHTYGPSFLIDGSSPHSDEFKLPVLKVRSPDQHVELI